MENFENVQLPQNKFGLHQTSTIYCGVVVLSIAYFAGFLKNHVRSCYGRTLSLIRAVYSASARDGSARLCLHWLEVGLILSMSLVLLVSRIQLNFWYLDTCPPSGPRSSVLMLSYVCYGFLLGRISVRLSFCWFCFDLTTSEVNFAEENRLAERHLLRNENGFYCIPWLLTTQGSKSLEVLLLLDACFKFPTRTAKFLETN